jgi:hypothetical protein
MKKPASAGFLFFEALATTGIFLANKLGIGRKQDAWKSR